MTNKMDYMTIRYNKIIADKITQLQPLFGVTEHHEVIRKLVALGIVINRLPGVLQEKKIFISTKYDSITISLDENES